MQFLNPMTHVLARDRKDKRYTRGKDVETEVETGSLQPQSRRTEPMGVSGRCPRSLGEINDQQMNEGCSSLLYLCFLEGPGSMRACGHLDFSLLPSGVVARHLLCHKVLCC